MLSYPPSKKQHPSSFSPAVQKKLGKWLIEPAPTIQNIEARRRARMLSACLLVLLPLFIIPAAIRGAISGTTPVYFWSGTILLISTYVLSRTKYYWLGIIVTLAFFTILPSASIILLQYDSSEIVKVFIWMVPTLILGSLLLSLQHTAYLIALNVLTMLMLPLLAPHIHFINLIYPLGFISVIVTLLGVSAVLRQQYLDQINTQAAELSQSETLFRSIVENSHAGIMLIDSNFSFTYVNDELLQISGYSRDELIGRDFRTLMDDESRRLVADFYIRRQAGEKVPSRYEFNIISKNGEIRRVEISAASFADEKGDVKTSAQLLDITDRKQMETALRASEALYQSLVNSLPQNIFRKDVDGRYTFVNKHYCRTSNKSRQEIIGKFDSDIHPSDLASKHRTNDKDVMESGKTIELIEAIQIAKDELSYIHSVKTPTYDGDGHLTGIQGIFWDITDVQKAQEALRESESKNRALSESTIEALFFSDKGVCVECNQSAVEMFGYSYDELIGIFGTDIIAEESKELVKKKMLSGSEKPYEAIVQHKDGTTFPAEFRGSMYEYEGRKVRVTAVHDITERKKAEAALQKAHDELEKRVQERTLELANANAQLKKLDHLKNKFIEDMSHELRTPLANLNLYLDLLEMGKPDKREKYLAVLRQATARITRISEDVLETIRLELFKDDIHIEPVDLNKLAADIVQQQKKLIEATGLELIFVPDFSIPKLHIDRSRIHHCLTNLIANSINYTAEGQIVVRTAQVEATRQVNLEVADTGTGIAPEDLPHLFDRFYRGRKVGQSNIPGSGLGLALVKEIAELHGGSVEAENRQGKGSVFRLWLPPANY